MRTRGGGRRRPRTRTRREEDRDSEASSPAGLSASPPPPPAMGLLGEVSRGLVRGTRRMAEWNTKRGPRSFYKGRGAKFLGYLTSSRKFKLVPETVPVLVVPDLTGFRLRPYVSYRAPAGSEPPVTARSLFEATAAARIQKDVEDGTFDPQALEKYGFEPTQEGKLFQLFPKNFVR